MNTGPESGGGRIRALDGIRGLAIALVLVWHYVHAQLRDVVPGTFPAALKQAVSFTWCGVDLFFVLSGFLIGGILMDHRDTPNYFRTFYIRRVCRIFPIYYLHLALFVVLVQAGFGNMPGFGALFEPVGIPLWSYATFTQNLVMADKTIMGSDWLSITWSLAIEEQFYLVLPFVIWLAPRSVLSWLLAGMLLAAPVLRAAFPGAWAVLGTPWRADSLMTGALLAWLVRYPGFLRAVADKRAILYTAFGILLIGALATNLVTARFPFNLTFTYLWLAILFGLLSLIVIVDHEGAIARLFGNRFLVGLGTISYGVYLFHQAITWMLHGSIRYLPPSIMTLEGLGVTVLSLGATLAVATFSYRFIERPVIEFGHRFRYF